MTHRNKTTADRSERDLEALASVGRDLRATADLDRQLGHILRLARDAVGANRASVMLLNPQTSRLEIRCSVGLPPEAILSTIALGEGIAGWVAEHNEPFILHGPVTDPRFQGVDPTIDSSLCLPLATEGTANQVLGVLNLTRQPGDPFTVEDLRLASSLADLASLAVEKAYLYASLRERESCVARLVEETINAQEGPAPVGERGLAPALRSMVEEVGAASCLEGHFDDRAGNRRLPRGVETILFRVAEEALRSVVLHPGARQVWVALESDRDEARLSVRADGPEPGPRAGRRPGTTALDAMAEHLALAGGAVDVVTEPDGGTRVSARIPLAAFRRGGRGTPRRGGPREEN